MTQSPKNKFEHASYLASLASIAMYLDKTGVEWHAQKVQFDEEFMRVLGDFHEAVNKDRKEQDDEARKRE